VRAPDTDSPVRPAGGRGGQQCKAGRGRAGQGMRGMCRLF
jgi:hypothetical protein